MRKLFKQYIQILGTHTDSCYFNAEKSMFSIWIKMSNSSQQLQHAVGVKYEVRNIFFKLEQSLWWTCTPGYNDERDLRELM
jgi:hypothetical protein